MLLAAVASLFMVPFTRRGATCKMQVSEKRLAGAAMMSVMKKCETDAKKECEAYSRAKRLSGAAKDGHMKKCVNDALGRQQMHSRRKA